MTKTLVKVTVDDEDVSSMVRRIDLWQKTLPMGIGRWQVQLLNLNGTYTKHFTADSEVKVSAGYATDNLKSLMHGYLDIPLSSVVDQLDLKFYRTITLSGRDYGQDLMNKSVKYVNSATLSTILTEILSQSSCELELLVIAPGSTPTVYYGTKNGRTYVIDAVRDVLARANYEGYVRTDKKLVVFPVGYPGGLFTLKSVAEALDNNVIRVFEHTEADRTEQRNYIICYGSNVEDSWTEYNAADWTPNVTYGGGDQVISNYLGTDPTSVRAGVAAIKTTKHSLSLGCNLEFPKYGLNFADLSLIKSGALSYDIYFKADSAFTVVHAPILEDTNGNEIQWDYAPVTFTQDKWYALTYPVGTDTIIYASGDNHWRYVTGTEFNWKIKKLKFVLWEVTMYSEYFLLDNLKLPVQIVAIKDRKSAVWSLIV